MIGPEFVPDISIGLCWAKHWKDGGLDGKFGNRLKYRHDYPDYFPQAASNPQTPFCYPDAALGEFRRWLRENYLRKNCGDYLATKTKQGALPAAFAETAIRALTSRAVAPKQLTSS